MKRPMIILACLALLAPSLAPAQPMSGGPGRPGVPTTRPSGPLRPQPVRPDRPVPRPDPTKPRPPHHRPPHHRPPHHRPPHGRPPGHRPPPRPTPVKPRPPHWHRPPGWRPGHPFCYLGRCRPPYHGGRYRWPTGYSSRRWSAGQSLPLVFLSAAYIFNNYAVIGLDPPPPGYQWVRYGDDLLLVDTRTGRIADVAHDAVY